MRRPLTEKRIGMEVKIGFIDYFLDEWHANNYPAWLSEVSDGKLCVAYAYAEKDAPEGLTTEQWCEKNNIVRCCSIRELTELSDGIIVLSPDNCERHEELSKVPLMSGKPVYIDKTFSPDLSSGRRIFSLAEEYGTPVWSSSALRFAEEYRIEKSGIMAISSWGPYLYETYSIHQLEPVMMLMNEQASTVTYNGCEGFYSLSIAFADGRLANINGFAEGSPFMLNIAGDKNVTLSADGDFFHEFIIALSGFFTNGTIPVSHEETLAIMAVREAGIKAQSCPGTPVMVESI